MARMESRNPPPGHDPAPNVATLDDLRRADELRQRLEDRYFAGSPTSSLDTHADDGRDHWSEIALDEI